MRFMIRTPRALAFGLALAQLTVPAFAAVPTDPFYPEPAPPVAGNYPAYQWALGGHAGSSPPVDIQAEGAWDRLLGHAYLGSMDAGIAEFTWPPGQPLVVGPVHDDLAENFREHLSPSFGSDLRAAAGPSARDGYGHGMHVMGLMTGTSDNGQGFSGVCRGCSALLLNSGTLNQVSWPSRFERLVRSGAQAINMSFGWRDADGQTSLEASFTNRIENLARARDVVLVAAAGNDRSTAEIDFPAEHPEVIGVGGSGFTGARWDDTGACQTAGGVPFECGSNTSPDLSVAAPAKHIVSAWYTGTAISGDSGDLCGDALHSPSSPVIPGSVHPTATANDGYGLCTGTSMSTPLVTGTVGLIRSANPLLSADSVKSILESTARNPAGATDIGAGVVDASAAVEEALGTVAGTVLQNRLTPLFSLYSSTARDHMATTVPQMASSAVNDDDRRQYSTMSPGTAAVSAPYASGTGVAGVSVETVGLYGAFPGASGAPRAWVQVFTTERHPTTGAATLAPLYRLSYIGPKSGSSAHRDHVYATDVAEIATFEGQGYFLDGVEGYVYPASSPQPAGTVELLRRRNASLDDHAIFPLDLASAMAAGGYTQVVNGRSSLGWVYRNVDGDGDGLIDGFEDLIGTDPVVVDSDGDGHSDGVEVLTYPYGDPLGGLCTPIFADGFDSGDLSAWTGSIVTGTGSLVVDPSAARSGPYGLAARVQSQSDRAYVFDTTPIAETRYRAVFQVMDVGTTMPNNAVHRIFGAVDGATGHMFFVVDFRRSGDFYQVRARVRQDDMSWISAPWETVGNIYIKRPAPHEVEVDLDVVAGTLKFRVDANEHLVSVPNADKRRVDQARLGFVNSVDAGVDSLLFFDSFESCR